MDILAVINLCIEFISRSTAYLSTLPHPIEPIEELISVIAVSSSLCSALNSAVDRFSDLEFSTSQSFLNPLSHDILYAISQLNARVEDAKRSKIFQPNDVGLVRLPRNAWILINGTEAKAASLRSRLYVEKYRIRVLVDAVNWYGLRALEIRDEGEEREYQTLRSRLPLVAERLVGVWKDYAPRLKALENSQLNARAGNPFSDPAEVARQRNLQRALQVEMMQHQQQQQQQIQATNQPPRYEASLEQEQLKALQKEREFAAQQAPKVEISTPASSTTAICNDEKETLKRTNTCDSCSSQDAKYETHLLRETPATSYPSSTTKYTLFGLPLLWTKTSTHTPASHYTKPLPSFSSEIAVFRTQSQGTLSQSQHENKITKSILGLPEHAQHEMQKLLESRGTSSSSRNSHREFVVVGMVERTRRKVSHGGSKRGGKWWERRSGIDKRDQKEWVLVLKGETVHREERVVPVKGSNPWDKKKVEDVNAQQQLRAQQQQAQAQIQQQQQVLRHVEQRKMMSIEEAETKMDEMLGDLLKFEEGKPEEEEEEESDDEIHDSEL